MLIDGTIMNQNMPLNGATEFKNDSKHIFEWSQ